MQSFSGQKVIMRIPVKIETEREYVREAPCMCNMEMRIDLFESLKTVGFEQTAFQVMEMTQGTWMVEGFLEEDKVEEVENIPGVVNVWCSKTVEIY